MSEAALLLVCGRCGDPWVRWAVDTDRPFDAQCFTAFGMRWVQDRTSSRAWRVESPGMYHASGEAIPADTATLLGLDGQHGERWTPDARREWHEDDEWDRVRFVCSNGCRTSPQVRLDKLEDAATAVVGHLHDTRTPLLRVTVDRLLRWVS